jgi:DASS family divalent anion:Na+ symporter
VSQTAHLLALFAVFVGVGAKLGVSAPLLAFQLLFATNYFAAPRSAIVERQPAVSWAAAICRRETSTSGAPSTPRLHLIYLVIGTPWLLLVAR